MSSLDKSLDIFVILCLGKEVHVDWDWGGSLSIVHSVPEKAYSSEPGHHRRLPFPFPSLLLQELGTHKADQEQANHLIWSTSAGNLNQTPKCHRFQSLVLSNVSDSLHKTQYLALWSTARTQNCEARNVALLASGTHRGSLGSFDLVLSFQTCFACTLDMPYGCTPIPNTSDIKAQVCLLLCRAPININIYHFKWFWQVWVWENDVCQTWMVCPCFMSYTSKSSYRSWVTAPIISLSLGHLYRYHLCYLQTLVSLAGNY